MKIKLIIFNVKWTLELEKQGRERDRERERLYQNISLENTETGKMNIMFCILFQKTQNNIDNLLSHKTANNNCLWTA